MAVSGKSWRRKGDAAQTPEQKVRDPYQGHMGNYMTLKVQKLREQFQEDAGGALLSYGVTGASQEGQETSSKLFRGVSIWVNGYTDPPHQELKRLMAVHGGIFENYYVRSKITHIICANLPDNKIRDFRNGRNPPPVLRPEWVVDSIKANKLLPVGRYELERIKLDPKQALLPSPAKPLPSPGEGTNSALPSTTHTAGNPVSPDKEVQHNEQKQPSPVGTPPEAGQMLPEGLVLNPAPFDPGPEVPYTGLRTEPVALDGSLLAHPLHDPSVHPKQGPLTEQPLKEGNPAAVNGLAGVLEEGPELQAGSSRDDPYGVLGKRTERGGDEGAANPGVSPPKWAAKRLRDTGPDNMHLPPRSHSTHGDPNFIQNFYKYSRLHFIGTWRTRYENMAQEKGTSSRKAIPSSDPKLPRAIIHIDMDCFFVSVAIRDKPELADKPVAVCHSKGRAGGGTAEISSANYAARRFGVEASMFVARAKQLCPDLILVPYDFEAFTEVADQMYAVLHQHSSKVQALSCDEAFLDVTGVEDPDRVARDIRRQIFEQTGCPASAGVSHNILLARLATRKAKPNGQFHLKADQVLDFIAELPVSKLPGVGWSLQERLRHRGIETCAQLRTLTREAMQRELGAKTGNMLYSYARGFDNRPVQVTQKRKSVGAEVNWGIRFQSQQDAHKFLNSLAHEVCTRLDEAGVSGRTFTLKVKKRKPNAGEPVKFMGCGDCDNLSKSVTAAAPTTDPTLVLRLLKQTYDSFHFDPKELRGVGLQVTRLEPLGEVEKQPKGLAAWLSKGAKERAPRGEKEPEDGGLVFEGLSSDDDGGSVVLGGGEKDEVDNGVLSPLQPAGVSRSAQEESERELLLPPEGGQVNEPPQPGGSQDEEALLARQRKGKAKAVAEDSVSLGGGADVAPSQWGLVNEGGPATELDCAVLAELPEDIRREVEAAYGLLKPGGVVEVGGRSDEQKAGVGGLPAADLLGGSPIQALPPASQVDKAVLDALPLVLRRELDHAYAAQQRPRVVPQSKRKRGGSTGVQGKRGGSRSESAARGSLKADEARSSEHRAPSNARSRSISLHQHPTASEASFEGGVSDGPPLVGRRNQDRSDGLAVARVQHRPEEDQDSGCEGGPPPPPRTFFPPGGTSERPLMPTSFTQIDPRVLAELPEDIQKQVKESLGGPRGECCEAAKPAISSNSSLPHDTSLIRLWDGVPPKWARGQSGGGVMQALAEAYLEQEGTDKEGKLSVALSRLGVAKESFERGSLGVGSCAAVVVQYVERVVGEDLEEVQAVLYALRRLVRRADSWREVFAAALARSKVLVAERYGGTLAFARE